MLEPSSPCPNIQKKRKLSSSSESRHDDAWNEEKRLKTDDENGHTENLATCSSAPTNTESERFPLAELHLYEYENVDDCHVNVVELVSSEQERLPTLDCGISPGILLNDEETCSEQNYSDDEENDYFKDVSEDCDDDSSPSGSKRFSEPSDNCGVLTPVSQSTPSSSKYLFHKDIQRLPMPNLDWANSEQLGSFMVKLDEGSVHNRNPDLFSHHPILQPRMRSVLLDWMIEVCEVYKLHRETYYLAMDFLDRYLSVSIDIHKQHLQLIGVSCLLLASKIEEIYPPKVTEYAYVTDGACTADEIIKTELMITRALGWDLSPVTPNTWLGMLLQLLYSGKDKPIHGLMYPQFDLETFKRLSQLLDLCTLDVNSLAFSYCVLATSCLYLTLSPTFALQSSGLKEEDVSECVHWMKSFWDVLQENFPEQRPIKRLPPRNKTENAYDSEYNLITHCVSLQLMESAQAKLEALENDGNPDELGMLTPPSSSHKKIEGMS